MRFSPRRCHMTHTNALSFAIETAIAVVLVIGGARLIAAASLL